MLRGALANHPGIEVVGLAVDGMDALSKIKALRSDVATVYEMPKAVVQTGCVDHSVPLGQIPTP